MNRTALKTLALAVLAASILWSAALFAAGGQEAKSVTVKGEILDLACYLDHGASGAKHQQCALNCLKGGQPMGLLAADGKVYLLLADHTDGKPFEEAKTYAALQVEVTGPLSARAGMTGLTVQSVKKV